MSCSTQLTQIPQLLDGTLRGERASALAAHVVTCEGCRAALLTQRVPQYGLPVSGPEDSEFWGPMDAAILAELESMDRPPAPNPARWLTRRVQTRRVTLLAYAAALMMAVFWGWSRSPAPDHIAVPATATSPALEDNRQPTDAPAERRRRVEPASYVPAHGSL